VTPLRTRLIRVVAMALLVLALTANVAAAEDGGSGLDSVPYDPGLPSSELQPSSPPCWSIAE
jgi:hypothetical protein